MIGEIWETITEGISIAWETITEGISIAWETITEIPSQFEGFFTEVNMYGWFLLSIISEICLWGFWYYCVYIKEIRNFLNWKSMLIATVVSPVIAYIFAWRASRQ